MVSSNEADLTYGKVSPCHVTFCKTVGKLGPRVYEAAHEPKDTSSFQGLPKLVTLSYQLKVSAGYLIYPADIRDSAKSGFGHHDNRHLNYLAESISMNVGGSYRDVKASSLPMPDRSVGGSIVLGARKSRVRGEGSQEINAPLLESNGKSDECFGRSDLPDTPNGLRWRIGLCLACGKAVKSNEGDKPKGNLGDGKLISGEPDAVKVASPVRRGERGNMPVTSGEHRMAHGESAPSLDRLRASPFVRHEAQRWNDWKSPSPIQVDDEPLGRSAGWMQTRGEKAGPERYW